VFSNRFRKDGVILIDLLADAGAGERPAWAVELRPRAGGLRPGRRCELRGNSHFDSSFIVSDKTGAVVLSRREGMGSQGSEGLASISNSYTIRDDWDLSSPPANGASGFRRPGRR
jgi:hypothetical protein